MEPPHGYGLAGLLAAKIICCGALVAAATGAIRFAGLANWLAGGGYFWLAVIVLPIAGVYLCRRNARMNENEAGNPRAGHSLHGQPE
ncbi:hypothetical protein [Chelativorans salis]|uniref:Uncharacterized protein n=1 Tax=Chelativorans salis TaxID=2978478 RepID=A0ABT2LQZ7_9HYPH|nr:hypothetical protein [Chelativorans sp. EGI FJ00035]MCT7376980.1 hypothetical protein [Chelativorans sp. EGI FJ00035]